VCVTKQLLYGPEWYKQVATNMYTPGSV